MSVTSSAYESRGSNEKMGSRSDSSNATGFFKFPSDVDVASSNGVCSDGDSANWEIGQLKSVTLNRLISVQAEWMKHEKSRKKKLRKYYSRQDDFIQSITDAEKEMGKDHEEAADEAAESGNAVHFAAKLSFFANILLMIAKLTASILSGSMAIISSLVDSVVDLVSGAVIFYSNRAARRTNFASYPFGRTRLEPAAIIIISVVMGLASLQVQIQSLEVSAHFAYIFLYSSYFLFV